jgi:hypothetical protein
MIVSDKNVVDASVYVFVIIKNRLIREIWWLKNNPSNPIVKYVMWRKSIKLAKELEREFRK